MRAAKTPAVTFKCSLTTVNEHENESLRPPLTPYVMIDFPIYIDTLNMALRASLTLQETRINYDSMNIPKIEFITYIYIYILYYQSSINFQFYLTWLVFRIILIKSVIPEGM